MAKKSTSDMEAEIERLTARVAELEASLVKAGQVASEIARIAKGLTKAQARAHEDLGGHRWGCLAVRIASWNAADALLSGAIVVIWA